MLTLKTAFQMTEGLEFGSVLAQAEGLLLLAGGDKFLSQRTVNNHSMTLWTAGRMSLYDGATFNNARSEERRVGNECRSQCSSGRTISISIDGTMGNPRGAVGAAVN